MSGTSKPWLLAAIFWTVAVLTINSISVGDPSWRPPFAGADKLTHAVMYGVAAYAWRRTLRSRADRNTWIVALAVASLGALDEWHQVWVPGRSAEVLDWVADSSGVLAGLALWRGTHARRNAVA